MILFQGGYKDPQNLQVQVLQSHAMDITAYSCIATITRSTFRCGLDSITYAQKTIQFNKKIFPAQTECIEMVEKNVWNFENYLLLLQPNGTTFATYISEGEVEQNGWCRGSTFTRDGQIFEKSVEEVKVTHFIMPLMFFGFKFYQTNFFYYYADKI